MIAWGPFALLCVWEMVTQPQDIPAQYRFTVQYSTQYTVQVHCLLVLQVSHRLQPGHLLLHVQGLQGGHKECVE